MTFRLTACGWGRVKGWALRKFVKMTRLAPLWICKIIKGVDNYSRLLFRPHKYSTISVEATFHKNSLIRNLVISFVFFCAVEPIIIFFFSKPMSFFKSDFCLVDKTRYWKQLPYTLPIWILFYLVPFLRYFISKFWEFALDLWPLTFDLQRSSWVKNLSAFWEPVQDFQSDFYWHFLSIFSYLFEIFEFKDFGVWPWPLIFRGHVKWKYFHHSKAHTRLPL